MCARRRSTRPRSGHFWMNTNTASQGLRGRRRGLESGSVPGLLPCASVWRSTFCSLDSGRRARLATNIIGVINYLHTCSDNWGLALALWVHLSCGGAMNKLLTSYCFWSMPWLLLWTSFCGRYHHLCNLGRRRISGVNFRKGGVSRHSPRRLMRK